MQLLALVSLVDRLSPGTRPLSLRCGRGLTPVQHCVEAGRVEVLRDVLRVNGRKCLHGTQDGTGEGSPLQTAVRVGEEGMLRLLLGATRRHELPSRVMNVFRFGLASTGASPPSVDVVDQDGLTLLALAAKNGLLQYRQVEVQSLRVNSMVLCIGVELDGVFAGNPSMVRVLLEEGADASICDGKGQTPLAHAAQGGHSAAAKVLLKARVAGLSRYWYWYWYRIGRMVPRGVVLDVKNNCCDISCLVCQFWVVQAALNFRKSNKFP
ncbi:unnamed protein product [Choristocarpus tenellus]